jgi:cell division protein FtsB
MQEFFTIISNFGFPVAVAGYLLFRFEAKLESLCTLNNKLAEEIKDLKQQIIDLKEEIKELKR